MLDSKSSAERRVGSTPTSGTNKKISFVYQTKEIFLNDVCHWQMMLALPMMTATPNDVASSNIDCILQDSKGE